MKSKSHETCRKSICILCFHKAKSLRCITDASFFKYQKMTFESHTGSEVKKLERTVVYCNNLTGLLDFIWIERQYTDDMHIKVGIDGGGGFVKICLSFNSQRFGDTDSKPKFLNDLKYSDAGMKKCIIIGIVPDTQDNYNNVQLLWDLLGLNNLPEKYLINTTIATDLKMANILSGFMTHASTHPCTWCDIEKNSYLDLGHLRTINRICQKSFSSVL